MKQIVLPMYMGVILDEPPLQVLPSCAPHVYGGDPAIKTTGGGVNLCSPCIWG